MRKLVQEAGGVVNLTVSGDVTRRDVMELGREIKENYGHARCGLLRAQDVEWKLSGADVEELARHVPDFAQIPCAFLVNDDRSYGMFRMFTSWVGDPAARYQVFRDETAARAWLETCCGGPSVPGPHPTA